MSEQELVDYIHSNYTDKNKHIELNKDMLDLRQKVDNGEVTTQEQVDNWFNG